VVKKPPQAPPSNTRKLAFQLQIMKTIIVTGANGNLGTATVKKLLDSGYRVIAVDHSGSHLGFAKDSDRFELHAVDLGDEVANLAFIKDIIARHGKVEGALLLVGGFAMGDMAATGKAELNNMFALNFETAYFSARPLLEHMLQNDYGRLVFIGARPALQAADGKNMLAYALSKSLLFKLAEFINAAAKGKNVVASVVVPSTIDTSINRQSMPQADFGNWVKPEQLADVLEFICGEKGLPLRDSVYKVYNNA
jgi:NAD(P)-dependent dehydrogenase (short-subunit alcohol dehydrogenase family)